MKKYLKIVFLQNSPCIRNYKYAKALKKAGHTVDLYYTDKSLNERYHGLSDDIYNRSVKIDNISQLIKVSKHYDLIHSHNEPDTLTVSALNSECPVIHDTHDLISLRDVNDANVSHFEGIANKNSHGRIYSTLLQKQLAYEIYKINGSSEVIMNYISEDDKPKHFLPKLSDKDGKIHIVYEGGVGGPEHRRFEKIFIDLANRGIHVHIYPDVFRKQMANLFAQYTIIHYNEPVSPIILMGEMTQYDFGIIPWNLTPKNQRFLDTTIANKLFEYLAAGLPVFTSNVESYRQYFSENPYGMIFNDVDDLTQKIPRMQAICSNSNFKNLVFSYEQQIDKLISYYDKVITDFHKIKVIQDLQISHKTLQFNTNPSVADLQSDLSDHNLTKINNILKDSIINCEKNNIKLMLLAFVSSTHPQLLKKVNEQYNYLKKYNQDTVCCVIGYAKGLPMNYDFKYFDLSIMPKSNYANVSISIIDKYKPELIYMRYPIARKELLEIVQKYPDKIIFEHQTKELDELESSNNTSYQNELKYGEKCISLAKGIVGVTNEIVNYELSRIKINIPSFVMPNGINVENYNLIQKNNNDYTKIQIIYVSSFQYWQGFDRFIKGLNNYYNKKNVLVHLVGDGQEKDNYIKLINDLKLNSNFIFYGHKNEQELEDIYAFCQLAVAGLGQHRRNLNEACTLKIREYCARGIPFIYSGKDSDLDGNEDFTYKYPDNDDPLDLEPAIKLAMKFKKTPNMSYQIREFATKKLSWDNKIKGLVNFFNKINNVTHKHDIENEGKDKVLYDLREHNDIVETKKAILERLNQTYINLKNELNLFTQAQERLYEGNFKQASQLIQAYRYKINYDLFVKHDNRLENDKIKVSVVIVAYNTKNDLIKCINSVLLQLEQNAEIIVIDNGNNDEVLEDLLSMKILYVRCPINLILSEGRNIGAYFAKGEILAFLDDDAIAEPNYISEIIKAYKKYDIHALRGKVLPKNDVRYLQYSKHYDLGKHSFPYYINTEGNSAFLKNSYIELGGMNPLLFGAEGAEFSYRMYKKYGNSSCIYYPDVIIFHDCANSDEKINNKLERHKIMNNFISFIFPEYDSYLKMYRDLYAYTTDKSLLSKQIKLKYNTRTDCDNNSNKESIVVLSSNLLNNQHNKDQRYIQLQKTQNKPRLLFFSGPHDHIYYYTKIIIVNTFEKLLKTFFEIKTISGDCDYAKEVDLFKPDMCLFDTGIDSLKYRASNIINTNYAPEIPKAGICRQDLQSPNKPQVFDLLDKWGVEVLFARAFRPQEAPYGWQDKTIYIPLWFDDDIFHDYNEEKIIPVGLIGNGFFSEDRYPWRKNIADKVIANFPVFHAPRPAKETVHSFVGEKYARLLNRTQMAIGDGGVRKAPCFKWLEIPASKTCFVTEETKIAREFGFIDMQNCLFVDGNNVEEKIRYYLNNPEELKAITDRGYTFVHNHHNLKNRTQIIEWLNLRKILKEDEKIIQTGVFDNLKIVKKQEIQTKYIPIDENIIHSSLANGYNCLEHGLFEKAKQNFLKIIHHYNDMFEPILGLGIAELNLGNTENAAKYFYKNINILNHYNSSIHDPINFSLYVFSLFCLGMNEEAKNLASSYIGINHPLCLAVQRLLDIEKTNNKECRISKSIFPIKDKNIDEWSFYLENIINKDTLIVDSKIEKTVYPKISVCIFTYNRAKFISEAIESIIQQLDKTDELIVCDDGSTDNTQEVVKSFTEKHSNILYFYKEHSGAPATRNLCIEKASGDFLMWFGSDDILPQGVISTYKSKILAHPDVDVFYGDLYKFGDLSKTGSDKLIYENYYNRNDYLLSRLFSGNRIPDGGSIVRKQIYDKIGAYDPEFPRCQDYDFWSRAVEVAKFLHVGIYTLKWRWHDNNMSTESVNYDRKYECKIIKRMKQKYSWEELFPTFNWDDESKIKSEFIANVEYANTLANWKSLDALEQYKLAIQKLYPDFNFSDNDGFNQVIEVYSTLQNILKNSPDFFDDLSRKINRLFDFICMQQVENMIINNKEDAIKELSNCANKLKKNPGNIIFSQKIIDISLMKFSTCKNQKEKVSVIIPYYKQLNTIEDTLLSVCNQTYKNIEIILVNDGDDDSVISILKRVSETYPEIVIKYYHKKNSGLADTRNFGISQAEGKYILPLDSDDMISSLYLELLVPVLERNANISFVYPETLFFGEKNEIWAYQDFDPNLLLQRNLMTCTSLFKKELWVKVGGYKTNMTHGYEDWDFWITAVENGFMADNVHLPLFLYRRKKNSMLENRVKYDLIAKKQIIENHPKLFSQTYCEHLLNEHIGFIPIDLQIKQHHKVSHTNKILFICHDFPPFRYAGAQLYAKNLALAINKLGLVKVEVLHPVFLNHDKSVGGYERVIYDDLVVHRIYKTPNVLDYQNVRSDLIFNFLNKFFEDNHYDLIHFHGLGQMSAVPIEVLSNKNIPMIMTLHDYWFLCDEWHLMTPNQNLCSGPDSVEKCTECLLKNHVELVKRTELKEIALEYKKYRKTYLYEQYNKINHLYAPSNYLKNKFYSYGLKNISVNPLGFILQKTKEKVKSEFLRFGYAGQLIRRKGINTLVEAFLKINNSKVQLHIWGKSYDESFKNELFNMISNKNNIVYHGEYKPEDLPDIFANIDITVIPSLMENYPLLVQESYMFKTPVIASDAGGIPEAVSNDVNGLIFRTGNVIDLYEKMIQVISHPSLIKKYTKNISVVKDISADAKFYVNEYDKIINHKQSSSNRILIYYFKNVHIPILKPITEALKQRDDIDLAIGYMHYAPEIRAGFLPEELDTIKSYGLPMYDIPQDFKPDVTMIADSVYTWVKNCGKLINVGHGVLSKGQYYTNTETAKREELSDVVCVPGRYHKEMMEKIISKPVLATGMAKLDDLFSKKINRETELQRLGLPKDVFYVLFAPTFNDELSAIPYVKDKIYEVLPDPNSVLIIKLHGSTAQHYKDMYSQLHKIDKRVFFINELDITPYLAIADVLISDVSSVMMEFAALDKPVVLFNNPLQKTYKNYNPTDLEYTHRDIGYQVESLDEMKLAVLKLHRGIDLHKEKRKFITDMLFENKYDGKATERIVKILISL